MQFSRPTKMVCCTAVGIVIALTAWGFSDPGYDARVSFTGSPSRSDILNGVQKAFRRMSLIKLVDQYGLYSRELVRMPMADIVEGMREDITFSGELPETFELKFHYRDRSAAQKVATELAALMELPTGIRSTKTAPDKAHWMFLVIGLAGGLFAGLLMVASGRRLIGWSLLGAGLGFASSWLVTPTYVSQALILAAGALNSDHLAQQISEFHFLPLQEVRNHLLLAQLPFLESPKLVTLTYTDKDPILAERVVTWVVKRPEYAPGVPEDQVMLAQPNGPKRPIFAGAGLMLGVAAWAVLALRNRLRRPNLLPSS
jgi:hypothetical protein